MVLYIENHTDSTKEIGIANKRIQFIMKDFRVKMWCVSCDHASHMHTMKEKHANFDHLGRVSKQAQGGRGY